MQASVRLPVSEYSKLSKVQVGEGKKKKKESLYSTSVALNSVCKPGGNEAYEGFSLCCHRRLPWSRSALTLFFSSAFFSRHFSS